MCAKRIVSERVERESIPELTARARLLKRQALEETDSARRSLLLTEADALESEAKRRLKRCLDSQCARASEA